MDKPTFKITYEIIKPNTVGVGDTNLIIGKHSGRHAIMERLKKMGFNLMNEEIDRVFFRFKKLADIKKEIFDEDLEAIIYEELLRAEDTFKLLYLNVVSGNVAIPTATMQMEIKGAIIQDAGFGVGPVDATFTAIRKITKTDYSLDKYFVKAITGGTDAQGEVTVQLKYNDRSVTGRGSHPDIIVASAKAYINALNRLEMLKSCTQEVTVK